MSIESLLLVSKMGRHETTWCWLSQRFGRAFRPCCSIRALRPSAVGRSIPASHWTLQTPQVSRRATIGRRAIDSIMTCARTPFALRFSGPSFPRRHTRFVLLPSSRWDWRVCGAAKSRRDVACQLLWRLCFFGRIVRHCGCKAGGAALLGSPSFLSFTPRRLVA